MNVHIFDLLQYLKEKVRFFILYDNSAFVIHGIQYVRICFSHWVLVICTFSSLTWQVLLLINFHKANGFQYTRLGHVKTGDEIKKNKEERKKEKRKRMREAGKGEGGKGKRSREKHWKSSDRKIIILSIHHLWTFLL